MTPFVKQLVLVIFRQSRALLNAHRDMAELQRQNIDLLMEQNRLVKLLNEATARNDAAPKV